MNRLTKSVYQIHRFYNNLHNLDPMKKPNSDANINEYVMHNKIIIEIFKYVHNLLYLNHCKCRKVL